MTYQKLVDWLVPIILGLATWNLQQISAEISELNKSMAVVVTKIDNHEGRLVKQAEQIRVLEMKKE